MFHRVYIEEHQGRIRLKSRLTCTCDLVTAKECDSEVYIVHRCFTDRDNSILGVFSFVNEAIRRATIVLLTN